EALDDPRRDILEEIFALFEQQLPAAADMNELDDRRRREHPGDEANRVAHGRQAEAEVRPEKEVVGDQSEGDGRADRGAPAESPGDAAAQENENQKKRLDPIDPQGPG